MILSETELALLFVLAHNHSLAICEDGFWRWTPDSSVKFTNDEIHKLREAGLVEWFAELRYEPRLIITDQGRAELRARHMIAERSL